MNETLMKLIDDMFEKLASTFARIEEVEKSIPKPTEPYDDTKLYARIKEVEKSIPKPTEPYDDTKLREEYENKLKEIAKEYDEKLQDNINAVHKVFEEKIATIEKELKAPIKVEIPTAKQYDGNASAKGQMILHKNNLYVNLLDDNKSEPCSANASYKLIISAPKAPVHKGLYDENKEYEFNDIVMHNNASWIKTDDPTQEIPSSGWKLLAKAVKGKRGEKGETTVVTADYDDVIQELADEITFLKVKLGEFEK